MVQAAQQRWLCTHPAARGTALVCPTPPTLLFVCVRVCSDLLVLNVVPKAGSNKPALVLTHKPRLVSAVSDAPETFPSTLAEVRAPTYLSVVLRWRL